MKKGEGDFDALICQSCSDQRHINKLKGLSTKRGASMFNTYLSCDVQLMGFDHMLGRYSFCHYCVANGECLCPTCHFNGKRLLKKVTKDLWTLKRSIQKTYGHIYKDFCSMTQIENYLGSTSIHQVWGNSVYRFTNNFKESKEAIRAGH